MSNDANQHPDAILSIGIDFIKQNKFKNVLNVGHTLINHKHYTHCQRLIEHLISPTLDRNASRVIVALVKILITHNKRRIINSIRNDIQSETGQKEHPCAETIRTLINQYTVSLASPDKPSIVSVNSLTREENNTHSHISAESKNRTEVPLEERLAFKEFYHSFLSDETPGLLIVNDQPSYLGNYSVHITKNHIDFRRIEPNYEKQYLYHFETETLEIEKKPKDSSFLRMFFDIMARVSSDVKNHRSSIFHQSIN
jgi:hypothetical protein